MEQTSQLSFVGIDVAKDRLDVAVHPGGEVFAVARDAAGLDSLVARLAPLAPASIAVEATGGYETVAAATLVATGPACAPPCSWAP
jgi:transposase